MNLFTRAPRIGRDHIHGIWAEGDHDASLPYLDMFRLAVSAYGHVVGPNERLTGAQWIRRIRSQYSAEVPRNRAVLDVIERVMMVDHQEFADDSVLFNPYGQPSTRGGRSSRSDRPTSWTRPFAKKRTWPWRTCDCPEQSWCAATAPAGSTASRWRFGCTAATCSVPPWAPSANWP
jgi:hypothetical protein